MTKVGFISLGCSKNLVDTEVMLRTLHDAGFEITPDETEAEIIIINTCGFIESAKQESIDNILDAAKLKEWGKCTHIIATGCLVERYREEVMKELPEIDALIGVGSLDDIAEACLAVMRGEKYTSFKDKNTSKLGGERILTTDEHTAYLGDEEISLTNREFSILYKLLSYPKKTFTRTQLMDEFWDADTETAPRAVDVYMTKLRSKLSECEAFEIKTVHGLGYKAVIK